MSYKGIRVDQDVLDERKKSEIANTSFPKIFNKSVRMDKINTKVIDTWIENEVELLVPGDDILANYVKNLINNTLTPDIKDIHLQLTSFLADDTIRFTKRLWQLLLDAQEDPDGIPPSLIKLKEKELVEIDRNPIRISNKIALDERKRTLQEKSKPYNHPRSGKFVDKHAIDGRENWYRGAGRVDKQWSRKSKDRYSMRDSGKTTGKLELKWDGFTPKRDPYWNKDRK